MAAIANPFVRVGLVWLGVLVLWLLLAAIREAFRGPGYTLGGHIASAVLATALAVPLVLAARRWLDRASVAGLGLEVSPKALKPFVLGALAFAVPSAVGFAVVLGLGWASVTPTAPVGEIVLFVPLLAVLVFLYEALPEELAFRGYIQTNLATRMSRWWAVVAQAASFSLWGTALWTVTTGSVPLERLWLFFFMGIVLGMLRVVTGSVWASIGFHVAFQTVAQLLLNDSRGHFSVTGVETLQFVALGVVPFAAAVTIVEVFYRGPHGWSEREAS